MRDDVSPTISRDDFRRWCDAQASGRYERVKGRIVAMAPERGAHLPVKGAALVNCGEPMADDAVAAPNPVIVVEVLSPDATATDTGAQLADYFRVPSVAHGWAMGSRRGLFWPGRLRWSRLGWF